MYILLTNKFDKIFIMKISILLLLFNLEFISINTYSQDIDLDCDCDYVIDDSDDDWPTGNLNNKTIMFKW